MPSHTTSGSAPISEAQQDMFSPAISLSLFFLAILSRWWQGGNCVCHTFQNIFVHCARLLGLGRWHFVPRFFTELCSPSFPSIFMHLAQHVNPVLPVSIIERLGFAWYLQSRSESCCKSMVIASADVENETTETICEPFKSYLELRSPAKALAHFIKHLCIFSIWCEHI